MTLTFYNLIEASLLVLNGIAIINRERVLNKWLKSRQNTFEYGQPHTSTGAADQILNLIVSVQTVMRIPLIFNMERITETTCLETHLVKGIFETFNKHYRLNQKNIERMAIRIREPLKVCRKAMDDGDLEKAKRALALLKTRIETLSEEMTDNWLKEQALIKNFKERWLYINKVSIDEQRFTQQKFHRYLTEHLLRIGALKTASKYAAKYGVENLANFESYNEINNIITSIDQKNLEPAIIWCAQHKSRLKKINSSLTIELKIQDTLSNLQPNNKLEVLDALKKVLHENNYECSNSKISEIIGAIIVAGGCNIQKYNDMVNTKRYIQLRKLFISDASKIYGFYGGTPFSISLLLGICAFKSTKCSEQKDSKCITCRPLYVKIGNKLPTASRRNSIILDPITKEILNENNVPMMLPNGLVYGKKQIDKNSKDGEFYCTISNASFPVESCLRVYIL
ncbi:Macrophage erythroblast attacher [Strongyloides ratti]|uniref:E3 ubiquitin-protein transferase MAEA n=1 Tax=Strongyloides ratti TaxID=34506 RepID=A0A090LBV2_STRRB|nr:Macrophage erythroblast attacher [Strongyloides ratti]CEF67246.1 Macrophage erythroblast attacher [Strongyloides ratti]